MPACRQMGYTRSAPLAIRACSGSERADRGASQPSTLVIRRVRCECCLDGCTDNIRLTGSEYEDIRREPTWFAVLPGHVDLDVERVVGDGDGRCEIVEKIERAAEVAERLDPRGVEEATAG